MKQPYTVVAVYTSGRQERKSFWNYVEARKHHDALTELSTVEYVHILGAKTA